MQQAKEEEALQIHDDAVGKEFTNGPNVYTESTAVKELNFPQKRAKIINTFCSFPLLKVSPPPPRNFPRKGEGGFPLLLFLPFPFSTGEKRADGHLRRSYSVSPFALLLLLCHLSKSIRSRRRRRRRKIESFTKGFFPFFFFFPSFSFPSIVSLDGRETTINRAGQRRREITKYLVQESCLAVLRRF